jgi:hypothetical protein
LAYGGLSVLIHYRAAPHEQYRTACSRNLWRRLFIKMPVPEFNEIKAPALEFFADGKPHRISEVYKVLAVHFKLTEQDLGEVLPSGRQSRWHNRANWACYDRAGRPAGRGVRDGTRRGGSECSRCRAVQTVAGATSALVVMAQPSAYPGA